MEFTAFGDVNWLLPISALHMQHRSVTIETFKPVASPLPEFREVVSSRSAVSALGATAFLAFAVACWWVPDASAWARWTASLSGLVGLGYLYRLAVPVQATLIMDAEGVRWSMGARQVSSVVWSDIRGLRQSDDDDGFYFNVGKLLEWPIPTVFLRTPQTQARFLEAVDTARPDLRLKKS